VTDWSGHIDALVGAGIIIFILAFVNIKLYSKIKRVEQKVFNKKYWLT